MKVWLFLFVWLIGLTTSAQESIQDLSFLIGTWDVREDNKENGWWEKTTRTGKYTLDSTYIQLDSEAIDSNGKERVYRWFIHYNSKEQQFEMVSFFSNWHKVLFDILTWDKAARTLTVQNKPDPEEFHERFGKIVFSEDFTTYEWKGENKYGDPNEPSIWKYVEIGSLTE